jgi:hypothetical protein
MAFTSLADRIDSRPLIICGPILRRVEADAVTVWVATREAKKVWLEVYEDTTGPGVPPVLEKIMSGERETIRLGKKLHIVAVTANLVSGESPMTAGKIYYYNLFLTAPGATSHSTTDPNLESPEMTIYEIHYAHEPEDLEPHNLHVHLPSFCLPPDDLNQLRIVHGSCRKAHAEGIDAMPGIDDMILADRTDPNKRPHYLLLTGDQFYADDISPIILHMLMDAEKSLLDEVEDLPRDIGQTIRIGKPKLPNAQGKDAHFYAGDRYDKGGFTQHEPNQLSTAGEFMCYYLFMWSDVVWQGPEVEDFPEHKLVGGFLTTYIEHRDSLKKFWDGLSRIKRAMANVPVYMIFDDHDVTDDWYMTYEWCEKTLGNDLGRRQIMNGLLSYAMFQAWGNTPELYAEPAPGGTPGKGKKILDAAVEWFGPNSKRDNPANTIDKEPELQKLLGIPASKTQPLIKIPGTNYYMIDQDTDAIRWDYHITRTNYEIKFLDGRTRRGYPEFTTAYRGKQAHPDIISEQSMDVQFDHDNPLNPPKEVTIVVVPTSLISIPAIEFEEFPFVVRTMAKMKFKRHVYEFDLYDHWKNQSQASEKFMQQLAERNAQLFTNPGEKKLTRVLLLTGDVHFGAASRVEYENNDHKTIFAQVISSSFKKQDPKTRLLHQRGYKFYSYTAFALTNAFITTLPEALAGVPVVGPYLKILAFGIGVFLHIGFVILDRLLQILDQTILKDWFDPKGMESRHFLGWSNPNTQGINKLFIPYKISETQLEEELKLEIPAVIQSEVLQKAREPKLHSPEWQYRIDFIIAANDVREPAPYPTEALTAPGPGDRKEALKNYLALAKNHMDYAKKWGNGKEIVGVNNISEVFFDWNDADKTVRQETWWRLKGSGGDLKLFPLSNFKVPLNFNDTNFPLPNL